jgi:hypothetical protein
MALDNASRRLLYCRATGFCAPPWQQALHRQGRSSPLQGAGSGGGSVAAAGLVRPATPPSQLPAPMQFGSCTHNTALCNAAAPCCILFRACLAHQTPPRTAPWGQTPNHTQRSAITRPEGCVYCAAPLTQEEGRLLPAPVPPRHLLSTTHSHQLLHPSRLQQLTPPSCPPPPLPPATPLHHQPKACCLIHTTTTSSARHHPPPATTNHPQASSTQCAAVPPPADHTPWCAQALTPNRAPDMARRPTHRAPNAKLVTSHRHQHHSGALQPWPTPCKRHGAAALLSPAQHMPAACCTTTSHHPRGGSLLNCQQVRKLQQSIGGGNDKGWQGRGGPSPKETTHPLSP